MPSGSLCCKPSLRCVPSKASVIPAEFVRGFLRGNLEQLDASKYEALRVTGRSSVYRAAYGEASLIVKIYTMHRFKDSVHHKRYGWAEWHNNTRARGHGIRTPQPYVYFESRGWGLVRQCGVIMEDLQKDFAPLKQQVQDKQREHGAAISVLKELYRRGVNHCDLSPSNIFFSKRSDDFSVIDWQYSSFFPRPNALSLCMMAATYLRYIQAARTEALWQNFVMELYEQCRPEIAVEKMKAAIDKMQHTDLHWKARVYLKVKELGLCDLW